jgi:hypothetical protein
MTVTLGWKHLIAALVLVAGIAGLFMWSRASLQRASAVDAERLALIAEIEEENKRLVQVAEDATKEADKLRDERIADAGELGRYREATQYQRENPGRVPMQERIVTLEGYTDKLEKHLSAANQESVDLRKALTAVTLAYEGAQERNALQGKRYTALKRDRKKEKRRRILGDVGIALSGLVTGIGLGRIGG